MGKEKGKTQSTDGDGGVKSKEGRGEGVKFVGKLAGGFPRAIEVKGNLAYVVSEVVTTLMIYNISNPRSPKEVGSFDIPAGYAVDITVVNNYVYLADNESGVWIFKSLF